MVHASWVKLVLVALLQAVICATEKEDGELLLLKYIQWLMLFYLVMIEPMKIPNHGMHLSY